MVIQESMTVMEKLGILADAAKYDVACTSSGTARKGDGTGIGNSISAGICHSFAGDGRCISLLKVLYTNECVFDCKYCVNRASNDVVRASFTPEEISRLTIEFYRRNYIEGLFLSSGVKGSPDATMEELIRSVEILRKQYHFQGYIHLKAIPGASPELIQKAGYLADRMSVNLELPTAEGLKKLAPHKSRTTILRPMKQIRNRREENRQELVLYRHAPEFVPAGQSAQMIVGAAGESDYQIVSVAEALYRQTGSSGFMASGQKSFCQKSIRTLICSWIPNATGPSVIWNVFLWRSTGQITGRFSGFPESARNLPEGFWEQGDIIRWIFLI